MPEQSENALVIKLLQKTQQNQVSWQPTSIYDQLATSFAGKYTITLTGTAIGTVEILVKNLDGDQLVHLTSAQIAALKLLHNLAKQRARKKIDDQLDEIVKELDKP